MSVKQRTRAWRRAQRHRIKARRKSYWGGNGATNLRVIDTPHPCSGRCCGNQRAWEGETLQERRQSASAAEELDQLSAEECRDLLERVERTRAQIAGMFDAV